MLLPIAVKNITLQTPLENLIKWSININYLMLHCAYRVTVDAKDLHSGISKVSFKFVVKSTGEVKNQKDFMVESQVIFKDNKICL